MNIPWFKNAVIYSLDVRTFLDSDNDGTGDFQGLTKSLDYLSDLGVTCLWLRPFYPSPRADMGYDITDFMNVDDRFGTLDDFDVFIKKARSLGIKIIADLVLHHTSDQHPWFRSAMEQQSNFKDYYIWTGKEPEGEEKRYWTYADSAGEYYLHRYLKEEPDLNTANPRVKEEIRTITDFWLAKGISGFNIDIGHILCDLDPHSTKKTRDYSVFNLIHDTASKYGDIILLARAADISARYAKYLGNGDRMNVLYNMMIAQDIFLSLAREEAAPLENELRHLPIQPESGQWLNMLCSQDELVLENLINEEREEVFARFSSGEDSRVNANSLFRRLAPLMQNNRKHLELAYSLLFSLPGIPGIMYGEELAMGDENSISEKVRTAMQWNDQEYGGFTAAHSSSVPSVESGEYGYKAVNVVRQKKDTASFLSWMKKLIMVRKKCQEIGEGKFTTVDTDNPDVFIHRISGEENTLIAVHNVSENETRLNMNMNLVEGRILFADSDSESFSEIAPYGYRWLLVPTRSIFEKINISEKK